MFTFQSNICCLRIFSHTQRAAYLFHISLTYIYSVSIECPKNCPPPPIRSYTHQTHVFIAHDILMHRIRHAFVTYLPISVVKLKFTCLMNSICASFSDSIAHQENCCVGWHTQKHTKTMSSPRVRERVIVNAVCGKRQRRTNRTLIP